MQIQFERIRFKNFLSFGDTFAEINLKDFKSTLITGSNFSGKSGSLLDTLNFALFGRAFRSINKPQLINVYNNKNCLVELEFEKNNMKYLVRRGLKPGVFEIFQNGRQLDILSSVKDQQQEFEKTVLNFSFQTFQQIVVLGSANYVPFMKLKPNDRRAVVDDILNLHIFTRMAEKLKADMSETKTNLQAAENQSFIKNELIKDKREHLLALQNVNVSTVDEEELNKLRDKTAELTEKIRDLIEEKEELEIDEDVNIFSAKAKVKQYEKIKEKIMYTVNTQKKTFDFFMQHSTCPTCEQQIEESFRQEKIVGLNSTMLEKRDGVQELLNKISDLTIFIDESEEYNKQNQKNLQRKKAIESSLEYTKMELQSNIDKIEYLRSPKSLDMEKIEKVEKEISILDDDLREFDDEILEYQKIMDIQKNCTLLLKDTGIKSTIMNKYLRMLNQNMELFLKRFGLKLNFELDNNFNENITNFSGHSFSYFSLSEGEKLRVDLAMMFSWRNIASKRAKMKTNMLILDEVMDGAADGFLQQELIHLLNDLANTNVFVISHRVDGLLDKFDRNLHVERKVGFSEIQERTL
jgi:DNA repair exonuclease SbcCD ATPase subunit